MGVADADRYWKGIWKTGSKAMKIMHGAAIVFGICLALTLAVGVLIRFSPIARRSGAKTTDTRSRDLADEDKIPFLSTYLTMYSEIEATEFHIRFQDNSYGLVPGPSDWDMQVVMKMKKEKLSLWTTGMMLSDQADLSWGYDLLPKNERWAIESKPTIYVRSDDNTVVAVFEPEGIVFKRVLSY